MTTATQPSSTPTVYDVGATGVTVRVGDEFRSCSWAELKEAAKTDSLYRHLLVEANKLAAERRAFRVQYRGTGSVWNVSVRFADGSVAEKLHNVAARHFDLMQSSKSEAKRVAEEVRDYLKLTGSVEWREA